MRLVSLAHPRSPAGAHTNPSLTFPTLRRLLGLVVNVQGGYKLGKLSSTSNWKDRGYYEVASIGDERERGLDAGFYVLLQPGGLAASFEATVRSSYTDPEHFFSRHRPSQPPTSSRLSPSFALLDRSL